MNTISSILFINEKLKFVLKDKRRVRTWISSVVISEKHTVGNLCYVFCSDRHLLEMNKFFLNHDYYTDILSFDYSETLANKRKKRIVSGDFLISLDRVKDNAKNLNLLFDEELRRVMVHGLLHLLGYSDKSPADKIKMRKKENTYLSKF